MKRKLVNLLIDMVLDTFSFVLRLKDDSPGIPVTNFLKLAEALAREGSIVTTQMRHAVNMRKSIACPSVNGTLPRRCLPEHYASNRSAHVAAEFVCAVTVASKSQADANARGCVKIVN
jgi:hypothetical protein